MSEPKFTPGPWKLEARRDICDEFECWLQPLNLHIHDRVSDEDAHLIAAAPNLYRELEIAASVFRKYEAHHLAKDDLLKAKSNRDLAEQMEAALDKARGEG